MRVGYGRRDGSGRGKGNRSGEKVGDGGKGMKGKGGEVGRSAMVAAGHLGLGRVRGRLDRSRDLGGLDVLLVELLGAAGNVRDAPCCVGVLAKWVVDVDGVGRESA